MRLEIEKKFLVKEIPNLSDYSFNEIEQGYLSFIPEIRIRRKGKKYYITKKGEGTLSRPELDEEINEGVYGILSLLVSGKMIKKTRYQIPLENGLIGELDIYHGDLEGLSTVEIEFGAEKEAREFIGPSWFGEDITEDKRYKNKNLARIEDLDFILNQSNESRLLKKIKQDN